LPNDKQILLKKLSTIFDPKTAIDFISPKIFKIRRHLTIEDLQNGKHIVKEHHVRLRTIAVHELELINLIISRK